MSEIPEDIVKAANECVAHFRWSNDNRWHHFVARALLDERNSLTQELNRLRDENARFEDKIEDIIAEFGADPSSALQIISEHIDLRRHGRAHPNARGEE